MLIQASEKGCEGSLCMKYNAHTEPIFKALLTLKLPDLFKLNLLKFYYNWNNINLPYYLQSLEIRPRYHVHNYNTRHRTNVCTKPPNGNLQKNV